MLLKVCGMKYPENVSAIAALAPAYLGFIFHKPSKRYCADTLSPEFIRSLPVGIQRVGVFVNEPVEQVLAIAAEYGFQLLQLHGNETPEYCARVKATGYKVIKAFHVDETFDLSETNPYKTPCDFFLFDTKTPSFGGSGISFNWKMLKKYDNEIPLFLSGGIDHSVFSETWLLRELNIHAFDINSRFEIEPGLKDPEIVRQFNTQLKQLSAFHKYINR